MMNGQFQQFQRKVRRSIDGLYHSYIASVLRELTEHERVDNGIRVLTAPPTCREPSSEPSAIAVQRELKLRGDLGCARVREQLWQLQHLQLNSSPA